MSEIATTLLADGRTVAAGLAWSVAPAKDFGLTQARLIAKTQKATGFLLRGNRRNLALISAPLLGPQTIALGDVLCQALGDSWCGVFELDGKPVFLAAHNGCVQPDGDQVYTSEETAKARLLQEAPLFAGHIYAPEAWTIQDTEDSGQVLRNLDWSSAGSFVTIKRASDVRTKAPLLIGLLVLVAGFAGFEFYKARKAAAEREAAAAKKAPPPIDPWRTKARPEIAAAACDMVRHDLAGVSRQGWEVVTISCDIVGRAATVTLSSFTTDAVLPQLEGQYAAQMSPDGSGLVITTPLALMIRDRIAERPSPVAAMSAHNYLYAHAGERTPAWQGSQGRAQFETSTAQPIWAVAQDLGRYPTTSIDRLEYSGGAWRVQGEIYD